MKKNGISRRDFLKGAALGVTAAGLAGCQPSSPNVVDDNAAAVDAGTTANVGSSNCDPLASLFEASAAEQGEISSSEDGGEYDVIVIGAGASGVPCAVKAYQEGASVLVLQKEATVISQGGGASGIDVETSDESAILHFMHVTSRECQYRNDREQTEVYVRNSGEAIHFYVDEAISSGYEIMGSMDASLDYGEEFGVMNYTMASVPKPDNTGTAMRSIMEAYEDVIDVRYSTPAVQLIKEGDKVTGVYAKDADDNYYKFTATKGVVIASGDYQNNDAMVERYCPDVLNFDKKQFNKTGDGQLMGMLVGAELAPINHTKMLHDFDSGRMFDEPFLRVDMEGHRFANEETPMSVVNNYMRTSDTAGKYCQIFDANYFDQATEWGGRPSTEESMLPFMPDEEMEDRGAVLVERIDTHKADTLEELAEKLELPADELVAAVERYNELVDLGYDADFGKSPKYMKKIDTAPFWGIHKNVRVSALCTGVLINKDFEVLDADRKPIENLYAIGNCSGAFYGAVDYPLHFGGMSLGRCVTAGYTLAKSLAAK